MENLMQVFDFNEMPVRLVDEDGEIWFVAKDICAVLGISKYRDALSKLDEDERGSIKVDTLGGNQEMASVNEPGLYKLILRSNKPEAKKFQRWVTHEVLPSIRKTGSYTIDERYYRAAKIISTTPNTRLKPVISAFRAAGLVKIETRISWKEYRDSIPGFDKLSNDEKWEHKYRWEDENK